MESLNSPNTPISPRQVLFPFLQRQRAAIDQNANDRFSQSLQLMEQHLPLSRLFKNAYHQTILNYITSKRISTAERLLRETNLTVEEISTKVGYSSSSTFSRAFQKIYAKPPNQYRKNNQ